MKRLKAVWDWVVALALAVFALIGVWALTRKTSRPVPGRTRLMHQIAEEQDREKQERRERLQAAVEQSWKEVQLEDPKPNSGVDYLAELYAASEPHPRFNKED